MQRKPKLTGNLKNTENLTSHHFTYSYTHTRTHARTRTHAHTRTYTRMHARTHARTHTHTHTRYFFSPGDCAGKQTQLIKSKARLVMRVTIRFSFDTQPLSQALTFQKKFVLFASLKAL